MLMGLDYHYSRQGTNINYSMDNNSIIKTICLPE